jgi:hypothetical protein
MSGLSPGWVGGDFRLWLRLLKKSEPTGFVQLSFLSAELEATMIQHRPGF